MKSRGKYKKNIELNYQYIDSDESVEALEKVYALIFSKLIQEQKKLRKYFKSKEFKVLHLILIRKRSMLADYLAAH